MNTDKILKKLYKQQKKGSLKILRNSIRLRKSIERKEKKCEKEIFKTLIQCIYTAGFSSKTAEKYAKKIENKKLLNIKQLANSTPKKLNKKIGMGEKKNKKIIEIAKEITNNKTSIIRWVKNLENGKTKTKLGLKTEDVFLRSLGFFGHFPVDGLIARFFERTGMLKYSSIKYDIFINPFDSYENRYKKLRKLIKKVLEKSNFSVKIDNKLYDVKNNPGIADPIIWVHCTNSKDYSGVCKNKPECYRCSIKHVCKYKNKNLK